VIGGEFDRVALDIQTHLRHMELDDTCGCTELYLDVFLFYVYIFDVFGSCSIGG
jgi:hypothetical protein